MSCDRKPFLGLDCKKETISGLRSRSAPSLAASSEFSLFSPRQAEVIYTGERPTCAAICSQVRLFFSFASRISVMASDGEGDIGEVVTVVGCLDPLERGLCQVEGARRQEVGSGGWPPWSGGEAALVVLQFRWSLAGGSPPGHRQQPP